MPRVSLVLAAALAAGGAAAPAPAGRAAAQTRLPLLNREREGPRPAPAWRNDSWLNARGPVTLESLRGRVVLLNFWVFTCSNCTNTLPSLVQFDRTYRVRGLTLVGIHTPEFPPYSGEHDRDNLERALRRYHVEYPNAQDNDARTWNLYGIRYWPSFVLIDKQGRIRYEGYGEFHLGDATHRLWQHRIERLLDER